ncbi:hypothetical protein Tcan_01324, partial [Toxocara canis]
PNAGCSVVGANGLLICPCKPSTVARNCYLRCLHGRSDGIRCPYDQGTAKCPFYGWTSASCDRIVCSYGTSINDTIYACDFGVVGELCAECAQSLRRWQQFCVKFERSPSDETNKVEHLEDALIKNDTHIYHLLCLIVIIFAIAFFYWSR